MGRTCGTHGQQKRYVTIFSGETEGKRPLRRREDNFKMDFQEVGPGDMDWIDLAQDRDK